MPNVGPWEIILLLLLALLLFGAKRLPEIGRSLGQGHARVQGLGQRHNGKDDDDRGRAARADDRRDDRARGRERDPVS